MFGREMIMSKGKKSLKELIKEFQETVCKECKSYVFCGGECMCIHFEKYKKENYENYES